MRSLLIAHIYLPVIRLYLRAGAVRTADVLGKALDWLDDAVWREVQATVENAKRGWRGQ